jgi:hypothetical protein
MELHNFTLKDKSWIDPIVMAENTRNSDFCFSTLYLWNTDPDIKTGLIDNRLIVRSKFYGKTVYVAPIGKGPIAPVVRKIKADCDRDNIKMAIYGVTEEMKNQLEQEMPGELLFTETVDQEDYIYDINKLADLSGRKMHNKRNHANKFLSLYPNWKFEEMKPEHFDKCRKLLKLWQSRHELHKDLEIDYEDLGIDAAFNHFDELKLDGGVLFVNDELCAFTIGEKCAKDTYLVQFEKANVDINGSYPMINREFVRMIRDKYPEIKYINRSDDAGIEALRKAKRSYYPEIMGIKYTVTWNE